MDFIYYYKTSDGVRREGLISASSREDVFSSLRAKGIRPIKVIAKDGSKENGEFATRIRKPFIAWFGVFVLIIGTVAGVIVGRKSVDVGVVDFVDQKRYTAEEQKVFDALVVKADAIILQCKKGMEKAGVNRLGNYEYIKNTSDVGELYRITKAVQNLIIRSREELRTIFAEIAIMFTPGSMAIKDAQRIYGEKMDELDAEEVVLSNRRFALAILDGNREKWSLRNGLPVFQDARLGLMFRYCLEGIDTDSSTARWKKDFGDSSLQDGSNIARPR